MPARPHQVAANAAVVKAYDDGVRQQAIVMATGTGKTWVFSSLYADLKSRLPGQMLVLAHTEELVDQNIATMQLVDPSLKIDKEMAKHKADPSTADVIVASVASLGRKGTSRVLKYNWDNWDKVIVDEAHHTPADSYRNVLECSGSLRADTHKLLLGVTATPNRSDGKALAEIFKQITYVYSLRQAISDGWLVDVKGFRVTTTTDLSDVGTAAGDYKKGELSGRVNNPARNKRIVKAWQELGEGRKTVWFAVDVQHAQDLAKEFVEAGIPARAVWGEDPNRTETLKAHRAGEFQVLINVGILIEGYDDPTISCIGNGRPTTSDLRFIQIAGRGLRLKKGVGNLKEHLAAFEEMWGAPDETVKKDCIIIDMCDRDDGHSLVTVPTLMGLPGNLDLKGQSLYNTVLALEAAQETHPSIDFSKLVSIDELQQFIKACDMFEVRFPEEVENNSELKWSHAAEGGYRMTVPKPNKDTREFRAGHVRIFENMLGQWEIVGNIKSRGLHGIRPTMEEAFAAADNAIRARAPEILTLVNRKASWHDKPVTPGQLKLLRRLGVTVPDGMKAGAAALKIDQLIARKAKR